MSLISVPRKRAAGNSPAAMVGVSSGLFGGFSNSIPIAPSVPVTLGQIMIAAIAGEDSSANQFITSGPAGWTERLRYDAVGPQISVWTKAAAAGDVGASSFTWGQSVGFPASWVFGQYEAAALQVAGTGNVLDPIGGVYDYAPPFGVTYPQTVWVFFGGTVAGSVDNLVQRAHQPLWLSNAIRIGLYDTNGPLVAGQRVAVDTTNANAANTPWLALGLTK